MYIYLYDTIITRLQSTANVCTKYGEQRYRYRQRVQSCRLLPWCPGAPPLTCEGDGQGDASWQVHPHTQRSWGGVGDVAGPQSSVCRQLQRLSQLELKLRAAGQWGSRSVAAHCLL
jgi:hypothetical protein